MPDNEDLSSSRSALLSGQIFRESRPSDEAAVREIYRQANLVFQSENSATIKGGTALNETAMSTRLHVCEWNSEVVAVIQWRLVLPEAEVLDVAVAQAHRHRGHASFLLGRFLEFVTKTGVREVFLEVRESNAAAIALYSKFAFEISGRRPNYYRNPEEAALLLKRKLTG